MKNFEEAFGQLLEQQKRGAAGVRLEMLERDLTGTKKLCEILRQVFGGLEELSLEHELVSESGVKIYADVYHRTLRTVFEAHGYVAHVEKLTREKHSFEQMRIRSIMKLNLKYMPFSWDELDKKPEACIRSVYELLGRFGDGSSSAWMELPVYQREVIRCAVMHTGPFSVSDAAVWLQLSDVSSRRLLRRMVDRGLLLTEGGGPNRFHRLRLSEAAIRLL